MSLPRSRPSEQGVDASALLALVDELDASDLEFHSLMVLRHGSVVAEGWWQPFTPEGVHLVYSLSKSFTSAAVGWAIAEGLFGLDDPLVDHLGEFAGGPVNDRVAAMTVRHALTMTTGHDADPLLSMFGWILEHPGEDWLHGFLALVPEHEPGWPFTYNQFATYSLARIVEARSGERLLDYLRPRILDPLGIDDARWIAEGGHDLGFSGIHVTTEAIAALGELHLRGGRWGDDQLLPADWVAAATATQVPNDLPNRGALDQNDFPDWTAGYGYQFWTCLDGYRGDGALGQLMVIWPDLDVVVAVTASIEAMQDELDLLRSGIRAAITAGETAVADPDAEARLAQRLRELRLPTRQDHGDGSAAGTFHRADGDAAATVAAVTLTPVEDGWDLTLDHAAGPATVPVGRGEWRTGTWPAHRERPGQPVASAGALGPDGRFHLDLVFTNTPHHLLIDLDLADHSASFRWNAFPLHGSDPSNFVPAT